ncbi:hypothetical protein HN832_04730 [archaeon]|nr:hypothetical protein [archaeon]MBT4373994.1 hypothetical protein [archaeon]MBT4532090.1 hypothetical protein [archaeon]MBT7001980.1 hypothetical protein [archaeon]MBT7282691.1 hypothetical protein [archaeon]
MRYKNCEGCDAKCCKHVAVEIDEPEEKEDFENIKWYVCHKNVNVFVEESKWYVEFLTPCEHLMENNKCHIYSQRPKICCEYSEEDCVFEGYKDELIFKTIEDVEKYVGEKFGGKQ